MSNRIISFAIVLAALLSPVSASSQNIITRKTPSASTPKPKPAPNKPKKNATHKQPGRRTGGGYADSVAVYRPSSKYLRVDGFSEDIHYNVKAEAATFSYDVDCSSSYEVTLLPSWCTLESKGAKQFVIRQDANNTSQERSDWFRVKAAHGAQIDIYLTQAAANSGNYGYHGTTREYTDVAKALPSITKSIKEWDECKTGAITETGAGVAIYSTNGYSYTGIPTQMADKIKELNKNNKIINDVALSGSTWWCVIYDKNIYYGVIPDKLKEKLDLYYKDGEEIMSVSINSTGDFTLVTDKHITASNDTDYQNMLKAKEKFGHIYSACTTPKGLVVCCENGCFYSNIPTNVEQKIKEVSFIPKVVKFTDSGTMLITDGEKKNHFYM